MATLENVRPEDRALLLSAQTLIDTGRFVEAIAALESLVPANPECARLVLLLRRSVSELPPEQRGKAEARLFQLFTRLEREQRQEAHRSANLAFGSALFAPHPDKELDWLRLATGRSDRHYYALTKLAERRWRNGELNRSRGLLERALSLQRNLAEAWLILAAVEQDSGKTKSAARYYRSYLDLRPLDRDVTLRYVRLLLHDLERPAQAEPVLLSLEKADPGNLEVGLDIAAMRWLEGDTASAEAKYREMLERHPDDLRVLVNLGNLYYAALDKPAKALQVYRYLSKLPTEARLATIGEQLLFVPERIRRLEKQLGDKAPAPPKTWRDLL